MDTRFQLFPEAASTVADRVDALFLFLVGVALFFTVLICVLILYFGVKYRRGSRAERANPPHSNLLEVAWIIPPLLLTMVMFVWGADIYYDIKTPPADAMQIDVVARQWMWKVQHPEGRAEINELHVPVGRPIRLRMISEDVIHSFYVPAFRVKQDVLPAYYTQLWFEPKRTGEYHLFCAEYCGTEHSHMRGTVTVMDQDAYADWLAGETGEPPAVAGERLFEQHRCVTCHKPEGGGTGPSLRGVFGSRVPLQSGGTVVVDEQYLRNSILNPQQQIVAGYQPLMPTFEGQLSESDVIKIIAYLKTLEGTAPPANNTERVNAE
jgi:cytochrome c oxidase subunit II